MTTSSESATIAQTVSPAIVAERIRHNLPVDLIDVRTPAEYAGVHAQGARLFPLDRLDPRAVMSSRIAPAAEPVYVICKSGARAARAVEQFRAAGFDNVLNVEGGTAAWEQAGLPVVRGTRKVLPLDRQVRIVIGSFVVLGVVLGWLVHPGFAGISAFMGAGLVFAGITDWCGLAMVIARMPWNQGCGDGASCSCPPQR